MRVPILTGTIKRRLLINFRADPGAVAKLLPEPFRPKLQKGFAIVGICLIRLEQERPAGVPAMLGMSGEHAAHRFAIEWTDPSGKACEGVFIPRRDTDSYLARLAGGRVFPIESQASSFIVHDSDGHVDFCMDSKDGTCHVEVVGDEATDLPKGSCFGSLIEASAFFEGGSLGYSPDRDLEKLNGIELCTQNWRVGAFDVSRVHSSYFEDAANFPPGTVEFDHGLIMRDIPDEWRTAGQFAFQGAAPSGVV